MTAELKLDVVRESDFVIEESDKTVFITGTNFTLPPFDANQWSNKSLFIQAYDLKLSTDIITPSKQILITTRYLRNEANVTLSVSGKDGAPYPTPANNGRGVGAAGSNGLKGRTGDNAGNIKICAAEYIGPGVLLLANGGNGSVGQKGGNGQQGANGANAPDRSGRDDGGGIRGGNGQRGGSAGRGGAGGDGGNGGSVTLILKSSDQKELFTIETKAGKAGEPGSNGLAGPGGNGGRGGRGLHCEWEGPIRDF
ncbi:hypothetical protein [Aliikangiella sp. IMCC44359]|uniref:hypothetical protein n=1 Tax=Aliikangiella sp. IMCC44359 TaxID=3459125 RepID=UPI00403B1374